MARGSVDVLDVADMLNAASKEGCGGMDLLCFHLSIFETLIVARELYVKNNFIYDFFYDFNMIKFMICFFSIFSLWKKYDEIYDEIYGFFFRSGIFMIFLWFF